MALVLYILGGILIVAGALVAGNALISADELRQVGFDETLTSIVTGSAVGGGIGLVLTGLVVIAVGRILDIVVEIRNQLRPDDPLADDRHRQRPTEPRVFKDFLP